jgi:hypothetical protein
MASQAQHSSFVHFYEVNAFSRTDFSPIKLFVIRQKRAQEFPDESSGLDERVIDELIFLKKRY